MAQDTARESAADPELAAAAFSAAIDEMRSTPDGGQRAHLLRNLATLLVGLPDDFRKHAVLQCPELETAQPFPDTSLSLEDQAMVSILLPSTLRIIDDALLSQSTASWRKSARVIGGAMVDLEGQFQKLPLGLYVRRMGALVEGGELLARGDVAFMRLSDVRLPAPDERDT